MYLSWLTYMAHIVLNSVFFSTLHSSNISQTGPGTEVYCAFRTHPHSHCSFLVKVLEPHTSEVESNLETAHFPQPCVCKRNPGIEEKSLAPGWGVVSARARLRIEAPAGLGCPLPIFQGWLCPPWAPSSHAQHCHTFP